MSGRRFATCSVASDGGFFAATSADDFFAVTSTDDVGTGPGATLVMTSEQTLAEYFMLVVGVVIAWLCVQRHAASTDRIC